MGGAAAILALALLAQDGGRSPNAAPVTAGIPATTPIDTTQSPRGSVLVVSEGATVGGGAHRLTRGAASGATRTLAQPLGESVLRVFGREILLVDTEADSIRVVDARGAERGWVALPGGARPADVFVDEDGSWLVTSKTSGLLLRVDPVTGATETAADLRGFGDEDGNPDLGLMERCGGRLFVQVRRLADGSPYQPAPHGALAVFDLAARELVDCDAGAPGVQPIELLGPFPRFKMHASQAGDRLLVSATSMNHLDFSGGIERIDAVALRSDGFVVAEIDVAAMGAFAMLDDDRGVVVFHTDIVPSNHSLSFTVDGGVEFGIGAVTDLGLYVDALGIDSETGLMYMGGSHGAIYIVDTRRDEVVDVLHIEPSRYAVDFAVVR